MPRLTYQPSGMSRATRAAISLRARARYLAITFTAASSRDGRFALGHVQHAIDIDSGSGDLFRIERTEIDNVLRLHDRQCRRRCHYGIEIARRGAVGQVAPAVRLPRLDQCN